MATEIRALISAFRCPCVKVLINKKYEISMTFNTDGSPDRLAIFMQKNSADKEYSQNVTHDFFGEECVYGEIMFDDFDTLLRVVNMLTKQIPITEVSMSTVKRDLVAMGTKLALAEDVLGDTMRRPAPAFKAKKAKLSVIDAIVEVGHILDGGIDNIKV